MWQRTKGKFHLLRRFGADVADGRFLQSACGERLCFTSVDDAKQTLKNETNIKVLNRALEIASQATLRKAIETRIRKLASEQKRERKLRLIAKAYE